MSPITHFLLSWSVASTLPNSTRRDRAIITFAGIAPDLDGFGIAAEILTSNSPHPLLWWTDYHHILGHNIAAAAMVTGLAVALSRFHIGNAVRACFTFHLHLFCDVVGARGPDGYQWPVPYLLPFSNSVQWSWNGQWALNAWQNIAITITAITITLILACRRGYSPIEFISSKADQIFVATLRNRFPFLSKNA